MHIIVTQPAKSWLKAPLKITMIPFPVVHTVMCYLDAPAKKSLLPHWLSRLWAGTSQLLQGPLQLETTIYFPEMAPFLSIAHIKWLVSQNLLRPSSLAQPGICLRGFLPPEFPMELRQVCITVQPLPLPSPVFSPVLFEGWSQGDSLINLLRVNCYPRACFPFIRKLRRHWLKKSSSFTVFLNKSCVLSLLQQKGQVSILKLPIRKCPT